MKCEYCGEELDFNSKVCGYCGAPNPTYNDVVASSTNPIKEPGKINDNYYNSNVNSNYYNPSNNNSQTKGMAIIIGIMCAATIVLMIVFGITDKDREKPSYSGIFSSENEYVATYKGGEITKEEYAVYYKLYWDYFESYDGDEIDAIENLLYKEIEDEMLYNKAKKAGITLTEEQKEYLKSFFDDETITYIESEKIDPKIVREIYEREYIVQNYVEEQAATFSDEDVIDYINTIYEDEEIDMTEYNVQVIYYENEQSAQNMLNNIKNGANFDDMIQYSEDETSAQNNGIVAFYNDGYTEEEFMDAIKSLDEGQMYDGVLEISGGYCIVKMASKVENGRVNNIEDRKDLFYETFESELDMDDAYYYEEVAREVMEEIDN